MVRILASGVIAIVLKSFFMETESVGPKKNKEQTVGGERYQLSSYNL